MSRRERELDGLAREWGADLMNRMISARDLICMLEPLKPLEAAYVVMVLHVDEPTKQRVSDELSSEV